MEKLFFDNWQSIFRSFIITILAYALLVLMLRVSGKRTLSKMNAFDFIITIALGSALATVALNKDVALVDGLLVFALLIGLQFLITNASVRSEKFRRCITSQPTLLAYKGKLLTDVMKKERITEDELLETARKNGLTSLDNAAAIILETTGDITIMSELNNGRAETLRDVEHYGFKV